MSDEEEYDSCEKCGRDVPPEWTYDITLERDWRLCNSCVGAIEEEIEHHYWQDRYTEEHHERATSLLSEQDEIECVISDYEDGSIIVHTPYVSADVVIDFCRMFGFRIAHFEPMWAMESEWPCVADHGDTFQIILRYFPDSPMPALVDTIFTRKEIDSLDSNDKQF